MVLIFINLLICLISLLCYAVTFEIFGVLTSSATLVKTLSLSRSSHKVKELADDPKIKTKAKYFVSLVILFVATIIGKVLKNVKKLFKNNPVTLITSVIEAALCGGCYPMVRATLFTIEKHGPTWSALLSAGTVVVAYLVLAALTIYLGRDSEAFASIRRLVKQIGGSKAVIALDEVAAVVRA